jgi:hypothetical protein
MQVWKDPPPTAAQKLLWQLLGPLQLSPAGWVPCDVAQKAE